MRKEKDISDDQLEHIIDALEDQQPVTDKETQDMAELLLHAGECCSSGMFDADSAWQSFKHKANNKRRRIYVAWSAVAAAILLLFVYRSVVYWTDDLLPLTLFTAVDGQNNIVLNYGNENTVIIVDSCIDLTSAKNDKHIKYSIQTPVGKNVRVLLPDSSMIQLNAKSSLTYQLSAVSGQRNVTLDGEGYFDVKRDTLHPFIIQTRGVKAKVLGTSFNIRNYEREQLHITLVKGSLALEDSSNSQKIMKPGEDAELLINGDLLIKETKVENSVLWTQGYFVFDNIPLSEMMAEIGRWYNLNIKATNKEVTTRHIHFRCHRSLSIDTIVDILNEIGYFKLERKDNTIFIK
ncbi:FecR family protein [Parabacteroides bouchesdurhonensis]|uniref:FecR family protein n=1 Tax=Parabacteroides bouchesdurhonensis TaxID=1936995 RepID=UPI000E5111B9|nr:FecR family protein [Parabacteroides bouchesdurhonensis]RHJ90422.1 FecR family protein [Bacteroides sp. AM07-16]